MNNKKLGQIGEKIARLFLEANEFQILDCNYRTLRGEIDIIAKKEKEIHFIEVKTRRSKNVPALQSIGKTKCTHILRVAEYYLHRKKIRDTSYHIDAIEVYIEKTGVQLNYIPKIIEE